MRPRLEPGAGRAGQPVLTIRQPWASAIFVAGKDVENRSWRSDHRGRLWVHAGLHRSREAPDRWAKRHGLWVPEEPLSRGVILGSVELVDIVRDADSPWALGGQFHWLLRRPRLLVRPVPWNGVLGLKWIRPPQGKTVPARRRRRTRSDLD
jgi:ASCH domain